VNELMLELPFGLRFLIVATIVNGGANVGGTV